MTIKRNTSRLHIACIAALCAIPSISLANDSWLQYGNTMQIALPISALGITLLKHDTTGSKQFIYSFLLSTAITYALKPTINAKRPSGGNWSFPSGHTEASFVSSGFLWQRYGWKYGVPSTILGGLVGYSRVETHHHYWRDVIGGAAVGWLSSYIFTTPLQVSVAPNEMSISYNREI